MTNETEQTGIGIVRELGDLPGETIISEEGLAKIFRRHRVSIKRAVERGELPPNVRLFGEPIWTIQVLRDHLAKRLDEAKKDSEQVQKKTSQLST
ncbi:MAG: hypothetical protein A2Z25_09865 [Planctomycetes bacterium RBG_16_55_9]|jgi:hypothetical protein|nr:MAG: hypothetical protein A2Z25_09865 [Planctomycetes bacterium RBG_16_55_9]